MIRQPPTSTLFPYTTLFRSAWSTPQRQKLKFLPLRRYNLTLNLLSRSHDWIASGRQIAINGHIKFNLTIPLQQLNGLETLVIIMVANKYAFLQITRRRFLNEWEAFKKVISRRNIRRRITIPLTLSNLKLLRRITRTENILHRNFTRRQVAIQNRVANLASHFFDLVIGKILTSRLSLSKHLAHNLGNLLLLGKIGVFHNRRNASSRLLLLISKHLILCIYLVFRILA